MRPSFSLLPLLLLAALPLQVHGQVPPATPAAIVTPGSMSTTSSAMNPVSVLAAVNRAHTFGDHVSGAGVRYFVVTDKELANVKSPDMLQQRLNPSVIKPGDGVRRVEVVVDIKRPLFLQAPSGSDVRIGTVTVDPRVREIEVQSSIFMANLTVKGR